MRLHFGDPKKWFLQISAANVIAAAISACEGQIFTWEADGDLKPPIFCFCPKENPNAITEVVDQKWRGEPLSYDSADRAFLLRGAEGERRYYVEVEYESELLKGWNEVLAQNALALLEMKGAKPSITPWKTLRYTHDGEDRPLLPGERLRGSLHREGDDSEMLHMDQRDKGKILLRMRDLNDAGFGSTQIAYACAHGKPIEIEMNVKGNLLWKDMSANGKITASPGNQGVYAGISRIRDWPEYGDDWNVAYVPNGKNTITRIAYALVSGEKSGKSYIAEIDQGAERYYVKGAEKDFQRLERLLQSRSLRIPDGAKKITDIQDVTEIPFPPRDDTCKQKKWVDDICIRYGDDDDEWRSIEDTLGWEPRSVLKDIFAGRKAALLSDKQSIGDIPSDDDDDLEIVMGDASPKNAVLSGTRRNCSIPIVNPNSR
jgi:hypothetical protein